MHIVIIYENTGNGHRKLAHILKEYLTNQDTQITLTTSAELLNGKIALFSTHWNKLIKNNWIVFTDIWINLFAKIILLPFYYSLYDKPLFSSLEKLKPDMVISTAPVNRLIGTYCQIKNIPFFVFITSGVIFVDMLHAHATHVAYFHETTAAVHHTKKTRYFTKNISPAASMGARIIDVMYLLFRYTLGYVKTPYFSHYQNHLKINNNLKTIVMGPLREKSFYIKKEGALIRKQYNIAEDERCVLISNGGLGGHIIYKIMQHLVKNYKGEYKLNLLAVCGTDQKLYHKIQNIPSTDKIRITALPVLNSLADLYHIADCSIGRGTAGILMDSVVSQTPLIVFKKVTINDYGTLDIIEKYKIGEIAGSIHHVSHLLNTLLRKTETYQIAFKKLCDGYENRDVNLIENRLKKIVFGL